MERPSYHEKYNLMTTAICHDDGRFTSLSKHAYIDSGLLCGTEIALLTSQKLLNDFKCQDSYQLVYYMSYGLHPLEKTRWPKLEI